MGGLAVCCLALFCLAPRAYAAAGFAPSKFAAISLDARTGEVLYAQNADARRYPASLTKVMTLYLAFDALKAGRLNMGDHIRISAHAAAQPPSKLGLATGSSMTVRDALNVIVVKSANDVAVALAEKIGGSEAAFVREMNAKAIAVGMRRTHFANASGLPDPRNITTARDLAALARSMVQNHPRRYALFNQSQTHFRGRVIPGHNRLLDRPGIDGLKTGYINASGFNLMTSGVRHGRRVIAVVLGGSTGAVRDRYMARLMQASFAAADAKGVDKPRLVGLALAGRSLTEARRVRVADHGSGLHQTASAAAHASKSGRPEWRVQIGAFSTAEASSEKLTEVSQMHPRHFDPDDQRVRAENGLYLARFVASSRDEAEEACAVLNKDGQDCLPLLRR